MRKVRLARVANREQIEKPPGAGERWKPAGMVRQSSSLMCECAARHHTNPWS
jgi:hypothetical protein